MGFPGKPSEGRDSGVSNTSHVLKDSVEARITAPGKAIHYPGLGSETLAKPALEAVGDWFTSAVSQALAGATTVPITKAELVGIGLTGGGPNEAAEALAGASGILDPAQLPADLVQRAVTHLMAHLLATAAVGPAGPFIAVVVGRLAGAVTHQALDPYQDSEPLQDARTAVDVAQALANPAIGLLAGSPSFTDWLADLLGTELGGVISEDAGQARKPMTAWTLAATLVVAAFEVNAPAAMSSGQPAPSVRPVSVALLRCIPKELPEISTRGLDPTGLSEAQRRLRNRLMGGG